VNPLTSLLRLLARRNEKTHWSDVKLGFVIGEQGEEEDGEDVMAEITGEGVSLWRNMRILFDLNGSLNLTTSECTLTKEHRGQ
jgi:hypothetical protein